MHTSTKQVLTSLLFLAALLSSVAYGQTETFIARTIGTGAAGIVRYDCDSNQFELSSSSSLLSGTSDTFYFVYRNLTDDADIKTYIPSSDASLAGLMIRGGTAAERPFAFVGKNGGQLVTRYRTTVESSPIDGKSMAGSSWIRLRRQGNLISSYSSNDGSSWVLVETRTVELGTQISVGMVSLNGKSAFTEVAVIGTLEDINVVDPGPTDPGPTDPGPTDPVPTDPVPTDPVPTDPVPTDPVPTDPVPTDPVEEVFSINDIGTDISGGTATYDEEKDMFQLSATGGKIWGNKDDFHYVYREVTGDIQATVKVSSLVAGDNFGKAGMMFRESPNDNSLHAFLTISAGKAVALERRLEVGGGTTSSRKGNVDVPVWLRLNRVGDYISAYYSQDGDNWVFLSEDIINFSDTMYVGLAVAAHGKGDSVSADFDGLQIVELQSESATETFISADIGKVGVNGSAAYDSANDSFLIEASGGDIGHVSDAFHYVFREVTGDFETVAKMESLVATQDWSKAGLMVRGDMTPGSLFFAIFKARNVGMVYQSRTTLAGGSDWSMNDYLPEPVWMKISRVGNLFRAHYSTDGVNWVFLDENTVNLPNTVLIGMAVTSHEEGVLAYAEFSNLSVNE